MTKLEYQGQTAPEEFNEHKIWFNGCLERSRAMVSQPSSLADVPVWNSNDQTQIGSTAWQMSNYDSEVNHALAEVHAVLQAQIYQPTPVVPKIPVPPPEDKPTKPANPALYAAVRQRRVQPVGFICGIPWA